MSSSTAIAGSVFVVDLLWIARQPPATAGRFDDPNVYAPADTSILPLLRTEDVMIERIHGKLYTGFTTGTSTALSAQTYLGITADGNRVNSVQTDVAPAADYIGVDPAAYPAMATVSWMHWSPIYHYGPETTTGEIGTGNRVSVYNFDVKSRRRLKDWGDGLYAICSPSGFGNATGLLYQLSTSVLLSHR